MTTEPTDTDLLVGLDAPDDAAVYRIAPQVAIVQTVDYFTPIVDDPRTWGRIAAANSLSDIYAMGAHPILGLNLVGWPRSLGLDTLGEVLEGSGEACAEAGVAVAGGHSLENPQPVFGLAVTGTVHPDAIVHKAGAPAGSDLVLTKPLGTGIISSAIKADEAPPGAAEGAIAVMSALNLAAAEAMVATGVSAATDVTGFGLIGHLLQMLGGEVSAELDFDAIPVIEGAIELATRGIFPGGSRRNMDAMSVRTEVNSLDSARRAVLFDAQTSGGLLIAVDPGSKATLLEELARRGVHRAAAIGRLIEGTGRIKVKGS
ncbi:MAG: selenide, water dikinase SelD [Actinomycetota bacterium]|nr:selenide, water dikinase SelD [Actinomycetota bacterium]